MVEIRQMVIRGTELGAKPDSDSRWLSRLRFTEFAGVALACSMTGLAAALLSLPVQWRASTFPFGLNDFDPMGFILILAILCCAVLCWLPAGIGIVLGLVAAFSSHSRRLAVWSIIGGVAAIGIYLLGRLLWN